MIIFLYGEDSYRSRQKLEEIISHYKKAGKTGLSLSRIDCEQGEFSDTYAVLKSSSIFPENKLLILHHLFSNKKFQEDFLGELGTMEKLKDVVVVYEAGPVDQRLKLFKTLVKACKCQEFKLLEGGALKDWALRSFEGRQQKITLDGLDALVASVGSDLWRLSSEIHKLSHFAGGATLKRADVELMVRPKVESDIFKTIDAMAQKNTRLALDLVHKHLDMGEAPLYLLSMIAYQFKNLLAVKELAQGGLMYDSIVKKSGLHPFVVKKSYFACAQFSFEELKRIYRRIFQTDLDIKTGRMEPETALDMLVSSV